MVNEKQAIIKELPPAKWHNEIWFEVVRMQTNKRIAYQKEKEFADQEEHQLKQIKVDAEEAIKRSKLLEAQESRRQELEIYQRQIEARNNSAYNLVNYTRK
jgi:hypothetical protein